MGHAVLLQNRTVLAGTDPRPLEIFADGESFTTRVYGSNPAAPIALSAEGAGRITFYKLKSYKIIEEE